MRRSCADSRPVLRHHHPARRRSWRVAVVGGVVWAYCMAGAAGALAAPAFTPVSGSPFATGTNPRSVALKATVTLPSLIGLPFTQVCFYYLDPHAVMTAPNTFTAGEYKPTGMCVSTAATSDNTHWVYLSAPWTPPATLPQAPVSIIAIGFGTNGHASATGANTSIVLTN